MHSENVIFEETLVHVIPQCLTIRLKYVSIVVINVRNLFSNNKFPFLSSSCCPILSSFVKVCFVRALLGLFKLMLSEFSSFVWDHVLSEHFFSCGSSSCLSFLSFMRAHVRASRFLLKFIFYEPFFVCVSSCPQILLLLKIILSELFFFWGSSCWPRTSFCVNFTTRMFVLLLLLVSRTSPLITYFLAPRHLICVRLIY